MTMGEDYVAAAVAEVKGLRVGLIGLTTQVDTRVGQPSNPDLAVASPVTAMTNILPALAEISDVIVILSHCGYGSGQHVSGKAGAARMIGEGDLDIAAAAGTATDKPVVVIGGHSHTALNMDGVDENNMFQEILITQAGSGGKFLGDIVLSAAAENGRAKMFSHVGLHAIKKSDIRVGEGDEKYATLQQAGDFDAAFQDAHVAPLIAALDDKLAEQIGTVEAGEAVSQDTTINGRYVGEIALANFMNDALVARSSTFPTGPVDIANFNATGIAAGVTNGPPSFKAWYDVMPYADAVHVALMSGAQIQEMLDSNAKRFVRTEELGGDMNMAGFISRGFLHFSSALRYRIALGGSAAQARAVDVTLHGKPLAEQADKSFRAAFNTYISLGGFSEAWNGKPIGAGVAGDIAGMDIRKMAWDHTGLVYRNELVAHIRKAGVIRATNGAQIDGRLMIG